MREHDHGGQKGMVVGYIHGLQFSMFKFDFQRVSELFHIKFFILAFRIQESFDCLPIINGGKIHCRRYSFLHIFEDDISNRSRFRDCRLVFIFVKITRGPIPVFAVDRFDEPFAKVHDVLLELN